MSSEDMAKEAGQTKLVRRGFFGFLGGALLFLVPRKALAGNWKQLQTVDGTNATGTWGISVTGSAAFSKQMPISTTSGTLIVGDAGKCVKVTANITIPASVFSTGDAVSIYNDSAANVSLVQGAGLTLRLGGSTTTGTRTLAQRGMATAWFVSATEVVVSGGGLT